MKFQQNLNPKLKATFIHFLVSLLVFFIPAGFIFYNWFPQPYFSHAGGWHGIRLIAIIQLILGPVLIFLTFSLAKSKKAIIFDVSLITVIQTAALIWGSMIIYSQRPVAVVYYNGFFEVKIKADYAGQEINPDDFSTYSSASPPLIYVRKPRDEGEMAAVLSWALTEGKPESSLGFLYAPLTNHVSDLFHDNSDNIARIQNDSRLHKELTELLEQHNIDVNDVTATHFEGRYGNDWLVISRQGKLLGSLSRS